MKLLLDTPVLLMALADDPDLPQITREVIQSEKNAVCYSSAAIWEASIKHAAHPDLMPVSGRQLQDLCRKSGFAEVPVTANHVATLETLKQGAMTKPHVDPFDRIMLAQAKREGMLFLTNNEDIQSYGEACVFPV